MVEDCVDLTFLNPREVVNLYGLYFPRIDPAGRADFAVEWVRTNHISYRHSPFTSGYVYNGRSLGHPLGPDGNGIYGILRYFATPNLLAKLTLAYEVRGRLQYALNKSDIRTIVPTFETPEDRLWGRIRLDWTPFERLHIIPEVGLERITHRQYELHRDGWQGVGRLDFRYVF